MSQIKKYFKTLRLSLLDAHVFQLEFFLSFISIPVQLLVTYFFWQGVNLSGSQQAISVNSLLAYYFLLQILQISFSSAMYVTYELWEDINSGKIVSWLTRPVYYPLYVFAKKAPSFLLSLISSLCVLVVVFQIFDFTWSAWSLILGFISSCLGFILLFQIQYIIGTLTFWLKKVLMLRDAILSFLFLLGGFVLPIDLTPKIIQDISFYTPTPYVYYLPAKIFSGEEGLNWRRGLCGQLFWVILFQIILMWLWKKGTRDKVTQGA